MKPRILIVEDEPDALEVIEDLFRSKGYETYTARNGKEALETIPTSEPDILISDVFMPEMDGLKLLDVVSNQYPHIATIMMTGHNDANNAVKALQKGAKDFVLKPFDLEEFLLKVSAISRLRTAFDEVLYERFRNVKRKGFEQIIGRDTKILEVFKLIEKVAPFDTTVLIRGEHGTGKELVADAIHYNSRKERANRPFVKVNCGGLPETLLESELFGHIKGAFTGAVNDKAGLFEVANGGTIFLDEIGDISMNMQIKLLRVLQYKTFQRVGDTKTIKSDVRVIAATNKNLEEAIKDGTFREDLYYRLNVFNINLPSLRERRSDIPLLVNHFIDFYCDQYNMPRKQIDDEAMAFLKKAPWEGNVRELENFIQRALIISESGILTIKDFPPEVLNRHSNGEDIEINTHQPLKTSLEEYERRIILAALEENNWNKMRTAEQLDIHRTTFHSKLKKLGIE